MKLTAKGRYAVTAMVDMAMHDASTGVVALSDIAERQHLSQTYLEQLFAKLRKQGLVDSVRGPAGGYQLAERPEQISVAQIVQAADEVVDTTKCRGKEDCQKGARCLTHHLWEQLNQTILSFLQSVTLKQVIEQNNPGQEQIEEVAMLAMPNTRSSFNQAKRGNHEQ